MILPIRRRQGRILIPSSHFRSTSLLVLLGKIVGWGTFGVPKLCIEGSGFIIVFFCTVRRLARGPYHIAKRTHITLL